MVILALAVSRTTIRKRGEVIMPKKTTRRKFKYYQYRNTKRITNATSMCSVEKRKAIIINKKNYFLRTKCSSLIN